MSLPRSVVGWRSITENKAAAAFSRGFYDALGRGCVTSGAGKVSIAEAYAAGEAAFKREGFVLGDPAVHGHTVHGVYGMVAAARSRTGVSHRGLHKRSSSEDILDSTSRAAHADDPGGSVPHGSPRAHRTDKLHPHGRRKSLPPPAPVRGASHTGLARGSASATPEVGAQRERPGAREQVAPHKARSR